MDWIGTRIKAGDQLKLIGVTQTRDDHGLDMGSGNGAEEKLMEPRHRLKVE